MSWRECLTCFGEDAPGKTDALRARQLHPKHLSTLYGGLVGVAELVGNRTDRKPEAEDQGNENCQFHEGPFVVTPGSEWWE